MYGRLRTAWWILAPVMVLTVCTLALAQTPAGERITFSDVEGHWAQNDIEQLAGWGIITGMPDGSFAPEAPVTRAQAAVMLRRTVNLVGFQTIVTRSFTNNTARPVNDIHFDFAQGTTVLDAGPFGDVSGNGTSTITLANPLNDEGESIVIDHGQTIVLKFGTSAGSMQYKWWWWTYDGVMMGQRQGTGRVEPF